MQLAADIHNIDFDRDDEQDSAPGDASESRYNADTKFMGILVDSGAAVGPMQAIIYH